MKKAMRSIAPILSMRLFEPTLSIPFSYMTEHPSDLIEVYSLLSSSPFSKTFLSASLKKAVGMNSKKAKLFSSLRMIRLKSGSLICHICMKMRNWRRFMRFHRYFKPIARNRFSIKRPTETPDIKFDVLPQICSNFLT